MIAETAVEDAWMYLATPGLGLSYGIGKAQIMRFLAMARTHHDELDRDVFLSALYIHAGD